MRPGLLLALTLVAASGDIMSLEAAPAAAPAEVVIVDFKFQPTTLRVKTGTVVRWINKEKRTTHSIRFTSPEVLESDRLFPGDTWERRFDKSGRHVYTCGPHPEMSGTIEVSE